MVVDLAGDVALDTSHGFLFGEAVFDSSGHVGLGAVVADHAGEHDVPESRVRLAVAAAVESVPFLLAAARVDRCDSAEVSEGGFGPESFRVVTGGDEQGRRAVGADAVNCNELGGGGGHECLEGFCRSL